MLSESERTTIESSIEHFPNRRAPCIEALLAVQSQRGWVSDEALEDVASFLGLSPADLDGVATFYNEILRKPVGRHVIRICDSVSCWILGYENVREALMKTLGVSLGETTTDGRFTVLPVQCLGTCDHAPALMVDDDLHEDVRVENLNSILGRYR